MLHRRCIRGLCPCTLAVALVLASCGAPDAPVESTGPERIVLVVVDMLRRDALGTYGGAHTPTFDALAATGQRFDRAVASFHQTTMSMGALFTGRTPSLETGERARGLPWTSETWCGMARFRDPETADDSVCIPPSVPSLAERLAGLGYRTLGIASNELMFSPLGYERGFHRWMEVGGLGAEPPANGPLHARETRHQLTARLRDGSHVNEAALAAVDAEAEDHYFLYVHYMDVHDHDFAGVTYAESVAITDRYLAELLRELKRRGHLENALLVVVSDHGQVIDEHFPLPAKQHYGNPSFEPVLRIPLIVSPATGLDSERFVRSEDLGTWIVAMASGEPAAPPPESEEVFVSELYWQTYRAGGWKSVRRRDGETFQLFDLARDPGESRDVAALHPEVVERHRQRIAQLTAELAAQPQSHRERSREDERRLRSLGYLEESASSE